MLERIIVISSVIPLILFFTGIVVSSTSSESCPTFCVCDTWYGLQRASCTGRHLYSVHTGVSHTVQALDLSNNSISSLGNFELANIGVRTVKYLNLSSNSISQIDLNAFRGLTDLTVLDLTRNHLYYILSDVFVENPNLRIVKLSHNNFNTHIPKLRSPHLMTLSMASCQITHLPLDTFKYTNELLNLDLSHNLMIQIDTAVFHPLHSLKMLSLEGNPWSCNKLMFDVQLYLRYKNIEFNTVCGKSTTPKKFEKMIIDPASKTNKHYEETTKRIKFLDLFPKKNITDMPNKTNVSVCATTVDNRTSLMQSMHDISSYWFFTTGFIVGSAVTLIITYIWLRKLNCCTRNYISHETIGMDSQRLSLLSSLWQFEDGSLSENIAPTLSRAGTPPPAYREVMLRPGLYSCPATGENFNDNDAGYRDRYT